MQTVFFENRKIKAIYFTTDRNYLGSVAKNYEVFNQRVVTNFFQIHTIEATFVLLFFLVYKIFIHQMIFSKLNRINLMFTSFHNGFDTCI